MYCRHAEEAWNFWKAGRYGDVSLSTAILEYAQTHAAIKGAFLTFQEDAAQIYPVADDMSGDMVLSEGILEYAQAHEELEGVSPNCQKGPDQWGPQDLSLIHI